MRRRRRSSWMEGGWTDRRCQSNSSSLSSRPRPGTTGRVPLRGGRGGGTIIDLPHLASDGLPRASGGGHRRVPSPLQGGGGWAVGPVQGRSPLQRGARGKGHIQSRARQRRSLVRGHAPRRQRRKGHAPSLQPLWQRRSLAQLTDWVDLSTYGCTMFVHILYVSSYMHNAPSYKPLFCFVFFPFL